MDGMNDIFNLVFNDYITDTSENRSAIPKFNVAISSNMHDDYLIYADDEEKIHLQKMSPIEIENQNNYNGFTLMPNNIHDNFVILISTKQINRNLEFIYTYAHELTHVFDFSKYMYDNGIETEKELLSSEGYYPIYYWSEFHARYYSFKYSIKYSNVTKEDILEAIKQSHFKIYMERLKKCMADTKNGGVQILTELMYQYGRFKGYKEYGFNAIEQDLFPKDIVKDMFGDAGIRIYYLFVDISNYEDFKTNYTKIVDILEEIRVNFDDFRYSYNNKL
jgi:hypothetical protein